MSTKTSVTRYRVRRFCVCRAERATLEATLGHLGLVVSHHLFKTHAHCPAWLPVERGLSTRGIRPALLRVILRQTFMYNTDAAGRGDTICALYVFDDVSDEVGELEYGELVAVAEVDRSCLA